MSINEAIGIYLKHYPGSNKDEFFSLVGAEADRDAVRAILDETISLPVTWGTKSLTEIGEEVEMVMHERHPELSPESLGKLGNYFTYLVK